MLKGKHSQMCRVYLSNENWPGLAMTRSIGDRLLK